MLADGGARLRSAQDLGGLGEQRTEETPRAPAPSLIGGQPVSPSPSAEATDQLPLARAVALHLLPGTLTMAALLTVTPPLVRSGCSRVLAYQIAVGLVGVPVMLGVMLWHAR